MNPRRPHNTFPHFCHRILQIHAARDALLEVIEEVGGYAWNYANVPVGDWVIVHDEVSDDDSWFYPGVDMVVLEKLRN